MSAAVDEQVDESVLEDLDFAAGCEMAIAVVSAGRILAEKRCASPAAWILTCRRCSRRALCCDSCRKLRLTYRCTGCGARGHVEQVVTFERLVP